MRKYEKTNIAGLALWLVMCGCLRSAAPGVANLGEASSKNNLDEGLPIFARPCGAAACVSPKPEVQIDSAASSVDDRTAPVVSCVVDFKLPLASSMAGAGDLSIAHIECTTKGTPSSQPRQVKSNLREKVFSAANERLGFLLTQKRGHMQLFFKMTQASKAVLKNPCDDKGISTLSAATSLGDRPDVDISPKSHAGSTPPSQISPPVALSQAIALSPPLFRLDGPVISVELVSQISTQEEFDEIWAAVCTYCCEVLVPQVVNDIVTINEMTDCANRKQAFDAVSELRKNIEFNGESSAVNGISSGIIKSVNEDELKVWINDLIAPEMMSKVTQAMAGDIEAPASSACAAAVCSETASASMEPCQPPVASHEEPLRSLFGVLLATAAPEDSTLNAPPQFEQVPSQIGQHQKARLQMLSSAPGFVGGGKATLFSMPLSGVCPGNVALDCASAAQTAADKARNSASDQLISDTATPACTRMASSNRANWEEIDLERTFSPCGVGASFFSAPFSAAMFCTGMSGTSSLAVTPSAACARYIGAVFGAQSMSLQSQLMESPAVAPSVAGVGVGVDTGTDNPVVSAFEDVVETSGIIVHERSVEHRLVQISVDAVIAISTIVAQQSARNFVVDNIFNNVFGRDVYNFNDHRFRNYGSSVVVKQFGKASRLHEHKLMNSGDVLISEAPSVVRLYDFVSVNWLHWILGGFKSIFNSVSITNEACKLSDCVVDKKYLHYNIAESFALAYGSFKKGKSGLPQQNVGLCVILVILCVMFESSTVDISKLNTVGYVFRRYTRRYRFSS